MTIKPFLKEVQRQLKNLKPTKVIGSYTYIGINKKDAYGSPGGNWEPKNFPAFEFKKDKKTFLLRIISEYDKIVIEAVHLSNMLINYTLNTENFIVSNEKVKLLENYAMTVKHRRSFVEVQNAMIASGMKNNIVLEQTTNKLNLDNIIESLFAWAEFREKAKAIIRSNPENESTTNKNLKKIILVEKTQIPMSNLNQILFGPPGTGKTYNTVNKALEIIGESIEGKTRREIKSLFDSKIKEGQIVFTTFHQSMSYEDFIEGIKPIKPVNSTDLHYGIIDGIFKTICNDAKRENAFSVTIDNIAKPLTKELFEEFYYSFSEVLPIHTSVKSTVELKTKENFLFELFKNTVGSIVVKAGAKRTPSTISLNELTSVLFENKVPTYKSYEQIIINKILDDKGFKKSEINNTKKRFVIIIDEINRGNVSQIFGELITLIEDDKRLGQEEALSAILPYSKEKFGVPPNLYIIGTMNTADRSVEALDAALRRRFSFQEMSPKSELVSTHRKIWQLFWKYKDVSWRDATYVEEEKLLFDFLGVKQSSDLKNLWNKMENEGQSESQIEFLKVIPISDINTKTLLETINLRIEKLLDKDHQIGHSYFMKVSSWEGLLNSFYKNIIPLLQEYFFGAYDKLGLVLGKGFIVENTWNKGQDSFADFDAESSSDFDEKAVYQIVDYRNIDLRYSIKIKDKNVQMDFEKAIKLLMKQAID